MLLQVVVVRDRDVDAFGQPNFVTHVGSAVRGFTDEVNRADDKNTMWKHPDAFELYHLGSYDDADARFELFERPKLVLLGKDVKVRT